MKRQKFIQHLSKYGCVLDREGSRHSMYINTFNGNTAAVPRHPEIVDRLAKHICEELHIPYCGKN